MRHSDDQKSYQNVIGGSKEQAPDVSLCFTNVEKSGLRPENASLLGNILVHPVDTDAAASVRGIKQGGRVCVRLAMVL